MTRRVRHSPLALAALLLAAAAIRPLGAQITRDTVPLREIVVTATRLPTPRAQVAGAVTVITGEELRARGIAHVQDALREVAGIAVVQSGSFGAVTSLFVRGGESDYVRVLVDGVAVNQPGGSVNLASLSTDNVERVEIVRGPGSVLYGSDAVAGVVQVITRAGAGRAAVSAEARGGTYGTSEARVAAAGGAGRGGWSAAASRFRTDGVYALNNRYWSSTGSALLRVVPDAVTEAQVSVRYNENETHFPTDFLAFPSDSNQFGSGRATTAALEAARRLGARVEVRTLVGWHEATDRSDNAPDSPAETDGSRSRLVHRRRSLDLRANVQAAAGATLTVGGQVEEQDFRNAYESYGSFPFGDTTDVSRADRAGYAQLHWTAGSRASVTAGLRREDNQAFGGHTTGRAGLVVAAGRIRLRAGAGTGFKEPTMFETYGGFGTTGNRALRPERSRSLELGIERDLGVPGDRLSLTAFDQRFRDIIQFSFAVAPGTPNYANIAEANARGVEVEVRRRLLAALALTASWTWLHTEVADSGVDGSTFAAGRPLLRRPAHAGSLAADVAAGGRVSLRGGVRYVGGRDDLDFRNADPVTFQPARVRLPAYTIVDLAGEARLVEAASGVTLTARVANLLDTEYEEVRYYLAPGRTILVGVRLGSPR